MSVEGQFYFWLPLILVAILRARREWRLTNLLVLAAIASLAWSLWRAYISPESGFYLVTARAWEFIAGALCVTLSPKQISGVGSKWAITACGMLLISIAGLDSHPGWPNLWTLWPVGCAVAFIHLARNMQDNPLIAHPWAQQLGDMSYSLYLWHWPVWVYARQFFGENQLGWAHRAALLLLVLACSYLSWRWIEQPFRQRSRVSFRQLMWLVGVMLILAVVYTGGAVTSKGYPGRLPDYVARAAIQAAQTTPRGECFRSFENAKSAEGQFCTLGTAGSIESATSMLWGDSHANQYLSALSDASLALGQTGLIATMSGCRAFVEDSTTQYPDFPNCKAFNREVMAYLKAHPSIHTVILGRIWDGSEPSLARTVFLVRTLIGLGRKVVLIGPLPLPGVNVETAWATDQIRAGHAIDEMRLEATPAVMQSAILAKLRTELQQDGQLIILDPTQRFCDARYCYLVQNGQANFRDISHLTQFAAQQMTPDFLAALRMLAPGK